MSITLFVFVIGGLFFFGDDILHCSAHYLSAGTSTIRQSICSCPSKSTDKRCISCHCYRLVEALVVLIALASINMFDGCESPTPIMHDLFTMLLYCYLKH